MRLLVNKKLISSLYNLTRLLGWVVYLIRNLVRVHHYKQVINKYFTIHKILISQDLLLIMPDYRALVLFLK
jgi:hypothetical protein